MYPPMQYVTSSQNRPPKHWWLSKVVELHRCIGKGLLPTGLLRLVSALVWRRSACPAQPRSSPIGHAFSLLPSYWLIACPSSLLLAEDGTCTCQEELGEYKERAGPEGRQACPHLSQEQVTAFPPPPHIHIPSCPAVSVRPFFFLPLSSPSKIIFITAQSLLSFHAFFSLPYLILLSPNIAHP